MKQRIFPRASRIGFGCASLGSRIGPKQGLASLQRAFDAGVNWFDLAPSYGDGAAETIFAEFARGRRDGIHICTKCGIEPARPSRLARLLRPLARRAVTAVPATRGLLARGRSGPKRLELTSYLIRESLEHSLKRLGTDHVDVYALHDPEPDALDCDDVRRAIEEVLASGKARAVGLAGSLEATIAALHAGLPVTHVQIADPPFAGYPVLLKATMPADAHFVLVTHSIYGALDPAQALLARANSRSELSALLADHGYPMSLAQAVRAVLLDHALASNPDGVVLLSMFSGAHLTTSMARLKFATPSHAQALIRQLSAPDEVHCEPLTAPVADDPGSYRWQ
jgi:hypothetical protein